MKKRFFSLILAIVMLLTTFPLEAVVAASDTISLVKGESCEFHNTTGKTVIVNTSDGYSDYTVFNPDGSLKKAENFSSTRSFTVLDGEKIHILSRGSRPLKLWMPDESQNYLVIVDTEEITMSKGESCEFHNTTGRSVIIRTGDGYSHYTLFNRDGSLKKADNFTSARSLTILDGEKIHFMSRGSNSLRLWMPNESQNYLTKVNTETITVPEGESCEFHNTTGRTVIIRTGDGYSHYTMFNRDGSFKKADNFTSARSLTILDGEKIHFLSCGSRPLMLWLPNEQENYVEMVNMEVITLPKGESYDFVNRTGRDVIVRTGDGYADYTVFNKDGSRKKADKFSSVRSTRLLNGEKIYFLSVGSRPLTVWIPKNENMSASNSDEYLYDTVDPGAGITLPLDKLAEVKDQADAISVITQLTTEVTAQQKASATGVDLLTLYSEAAVAQAAATNVSGSEINVTSEVVKSLESKALETKSAADKALADAGITTEREMNANIKIKTDKTDRVVITVDNSAVRTSADNILIESPAFGLAISAEALKDEIIDTPLIITMTDATVTAMSTGASSGIKTYKVSFNRTGLKENITVSLPAANGDHNYQAILREDGTPVGGKYNPAIGKLEAKIKMGGTYTVKQNKKDFSDIQDKSKEMQEAIRILASKGIINGTTATKFSPDATITRAEIAALIVKTLSRIDPNCDGGFMDVKRKDWYFGAVGSAKRYGIVSGTSPTRFAPKKIIQKDQILSIAARTLKKEMKYKTPSNIEQYLKVYTDRSSMAGWSVNDLALASRENLVVKRKDGRFLPNSTMKRGDAAIILKRMFDKIW